MVNDEQLALEIETPLRFNVHRWAGSFDEPGPLLDTFTEDELFTAGTSKTLQEAAKWALVATDADRKRRLTGPEWWEVWHALPEPRPTDSRDVVCPSCGARAGTFCKRPSGHTSKESHAARWDAFLASAVLRATNESQAAPDDGRGR